MVPIQLAEALRGAGPHPNPNPNPDPNWRTSEEQARLDKEKAEKEAAEAALVAELAAKEKDERIKGRLSRVDDFFIGALEPYTEPPETSSERNSPLTLALTLALTS